jgi:prepilin-type N-terminal cleavage/methylation domain-containing protein
MIKREAFTLVELIFVIVIIGILSSMAVPKFSGVKDQAIKTAEVSTAMAVSTALESIHSTWSISDGDFDWNNDGVPDNISADFSDSGYPKDLKRGTDDLGALIRSSGKSGFEEQDSLGVLNDISNSVFKIYTAKASNPTTGISASKEIEGKPDKNDFWLYMVDTNSSDKSCVSSSLIKQRQIISGDFMLIDVNGSSTTDFTADDLGMAFKIGSCS